MKKLVIKQHELNGIYEEQIGELCRIFDEDADFEIQDLSNLNLDALPDSDFKIVIAGELPKHYCYLFRGMGLVLVTFGDFETYSDIADIVFDPFQEKGPGVFSGSDYLVARQEKSEISEVLSLFKYLEWDSNFFGFGVIFLSCRYLTKNITKALEHFLENDREIRLIEYLCNCHDAKSVKIAEDEGFRFVDIRLTFECSLDSFLRDESAILEEYSCGLATESDIPNLREIAASIYADSRYYYDTNFDKAKIHEFYQSWVEKAVKGQFDDACYVMRDQANSIIAFCTAREGAVGECSIGLVGSCQKRKVKGAGRAILDYALEQLAISGHNKVFVVTQGRNYAAQRLYQRAGFVTHKTELWYHKWR